MRRTGRSLVVLLIMLVGCSGRNPLVGTWKLSSSDLNASFVFKSGTQIPRQNDPSDLGELKALNTTLRATSLKFSTTASKGTEEYRKEESDYLLSIRECPTKVALIGVDRWGGAINTEGAYEIIGDKVLIWFGEEAEYRTWLASFSIDGKTMTWKSDEGTLTLLKE